MRGTGILSFIKRIFIYFFIFIPHLLSAQEPIAFEKHNWIKNTMSGHVWQVEYPIESGYIMTDDYDYEDALTKGIFHIGGGIKFGIKNKMNRGIAIGPGIDWTSNNYFRLNLFLDLDFLFQYSIEMNEKNRFTPSMFSKFAITKVMGKVDGVSIQEYYFRFNVLQIQIGRISVGWYSSKGLFRSKYPPHYADKGMDLTIAYIFK